MIMQTCLNQCKERGRATNGKIGPVDLSKNENDREDLKNGNSANKSMLILCL